MDELSTPQTKYAKGTCERGTLKGNKIHPTPSRTPTPGEGREEGREKMVSWLIGCLVGWLLGCLVGPSVSW